MIPERVPFRREKSAFDEYIHDLAMLGVGSEIILRQRKENTEEADESEDNDSDLPQEADQEGDNEE